MPFVLNLCSKGKRVALCVLFILPIIISFESVSATVIHNSQREWKRYKKEILSKYFKLYKRASALRYSPTWEQKSGQEEQINDLESRLTALRATLENLNKLEASSQRYEIKDTAASEGATESLTRYISKDTVIQFLIFDTRTFIHETTHGGQFEKGGIAYHIVNGNSLGNDLYDEMNAYKAQFAFDPAYFKVYRSNSVVNSLDEITTEWVRNLKNPDSCRPYDTCDCKNSKDVRCSPANVGLFSVDIYSPKDSLILAFPKAKGDAGFASLASFYTFSSDLDVLIGPGLTRKLPLIPKHRIPHPDHTIIPTAMRTPRPPQFNRSGTTPDPPQCRCAQSF